jgi:hypothetical protein
LAILLVPMHATPMQSQTGPDPESELRTGIDLTRQGMLVQAIPHLQAASGHVKDGYAAEFNLALCYVGTGQFEAAIGVLNRLQTSGHDTPAMNNLLAQAYVGEGKQQPAIKALQAAAAQSPKDEKLYALIADACNDYKPYELGLQVVDLGLTRLPQSPRLHYERALFLLSWIALRRRSRSSSVPSVFSPRVILLIWRWCRRPCTKTEFLTLSGWHGRGSWPVTAMRCCCRYWERCSSTRVLLLGSLNLPRRGRRSKRPWPGVPTIPPPRLRSEVFI